ncbi:MAG TPA: amino acid permease, partial [Planctomycetota bacterium]|nr:amino acid permease [Planctomycetota bacterium]
AWAIAGLFAVCGALSYGALARLFPESGGEYHFLRVTVHPFAGFLAGWVSLVAGFTVPIAIVALTFGAYVGPVLGEATSGEWIGTAAIALAALMHGVALRFGLAIQNVAVAVKLLLIGGFIVLGAVRLPAFEPGEASSPDLPFDLGALAVAVVVISFSYSGWNAAVYIAGEIREPERNLRRALLLGTGVVTIVYLALNAVFLWSAPPARLAGEVDIGAVAALTLGGERLVLGVRGLVALALLTSISAMVMAGPRVYARMAEDGLFPRWFRGTRDVPTGAVLFQAALAIAIVWLSELRALLDYAGFTLGISAAATVIGLLLHRLRHGPHRVPIPGFPLVPGIFVLGTLGAVAFVIASKPREASLGLLTLAAGAPVYAAIRFWRRRHAPMG